MVVHFPDQLNIFFFQDVDENSLQGFKQLPMAPSVQRNWTMFSANFR